MKDNSFLTIVLVPEPTTSIAHQPFGLASPAAWLAEVGPHSYVATSTTLRPPELAVVVGRLVMLLEPREELADPPTCKPGGGTLGVRP
jgi:hypothetical protein